MVRHSEVIAVSAAGLLQGLTLVTFPAASAILTSPRDYNLSSAEYGFLFAPQTMMAIVAALVGRDLARRWGEKRVYLAGLTASLVSMVLLLASRVVMHDHGTTRVVLLAATTFVGIGFGLLVPALNNFAAAFFPARVDAAVLTINALLGVGTVLAPILVGVFAGMGLWWGLPLLVAILIAVLAGASLGLPLHADVPATTPRGRRAGFGAFAAFALLYGVVETLNGNWAILYLSRTLGGRAAFGTLALTLFWAAVTGGRILFSTIERWLPSRETFRLLPLVEIVAFAGIALLPSTPGVLGPLGFALAGLGCSALLPLTISLGRRTASSGQLIAFYQVGYGLAAFGVGPLDGHVGLRVIYMGGVAVALALAALAAVIVHRRPRGIRP